MPTRRCKRSSWPIQGTWNQINEWEKPVIGWHLCHYNPTLSSSACFIKCGSRLSTVIFSAMHGVGVFLLDGSWAARLKFQSICLLFAVIFPLLVYFQRADSWTTEGKWRQKTEECKLLDNYGNHVELLRVWTEGLCDQVFPLPWCTIL